jgi:hypothetical protein
MFMLIFVCAGLGFAQEKNALGNTTQKTAEPVKKIYVIYVTGETARPATYILEDVEATEFNGIKCLKGKHVDMYWVANKMLYVPIDKILLIVEYDSLSQYKENMEKYHKKQLEGD